MKRIHPEDPRVTAHALGDLPKHEAAEIVRATMTNPDVQSAIDDTRALADLIRQGYQSESLELGEARREAIRRAGRRPAPENLVSMKPRQRWVRPLAISGMAAALVVGSVWMMKQIPARDGIATGGERAATQIEALRTQILLSPSLPPGRFTPGSEPRAGSAPSSLFQFGTQLTPEEIEAEYASLQDLSDTDPGAFAAKVKEFAMGAEVKVLGKFPLLVDNVFVSSRDEDRTSVPIASGSASYTMVERWVRTEGKRPPKNLVRVEELINHVTYEDEGDADFEGIKLGVDLMRCPWDEGAILMGILLQNEGHSVIRGDAILRMELKPDHIRSYRLLGYAKTSDAQIEQASLTTGLQPGRSNYVLYQLQPAHSEVFERHRVVARVALQLSEEDQRGLIVPVSTPPRDWDLSSNNLQTAAVLASFGMELRESPYRGALDVTLLEALTRETLLGVKEDDLPRREALQLILDSLPLLGKTADSE